MHALITGGAGFIGSHLAERLVAAGLKVRVLDDFSSGRRENLSELAGKLEIIQGSVTDAEAVRWALDGVQAVFHLAAKVSVQESLRHPEDTFAVNLEGTKLVAAEARAAGVRRLVFAGSSSAYGDPERLPCRESDPTMPLSPYAISKVQAEEWLGHCMRLHQQESVLLRFFNVYGPRQPGGSPYSGVIVRFFGQIARGETPTIYGDGEQTRDFIHVTDVAEALLLAAQAPLGRGALFNIGTGVATSLTALVRTMSAVVGRPVEPRYEPARAGDVRRSQASTTLAERDLGFKAKVGLKAGLAELWSRWPQTG